MVAPNMATLDQIKEVVRGETDNLEETNAAWIITGSACKKFLLSALAPQNSLRNLVVTFLSLSLICYENDVTFFKSSSVKNMSIFF